MKFKHTNKTLFISSHNTNNIVGCERRLICFSGGNLENSDLDENNVERGLFMADSTPKGSKTKEEEMALLLKSFQDGIRKIMEMPAPPSGPEDNVPEQNYGGGFYPSVLTVENDIGPYTHQDLSDVSTAKTEAARGFGKKWLLDRTGLSFAGRSVVRGLKNFRYAILSPYAWKTPYKIFKTNLDREDCIGISRESSDPTNTLRKRTIRYFALRRLTQDINPEDPQFLPIDVTKELTELRNKIFNMHMKKINKVIAKTKKDPKKPAVLSKETARRMGLASANVDNIPIEDIRIKLIEYLNTGTVDADIQKDIDNRIARAWAPLQRRTDKVTQSREWRGKVFGSIAVNPIKTVGKGIAGTAAFPFKMIGAGTKKLWDWGKTVR